MSDELRQKIAFLEQELENQRKLNSTFLESHQIQNTILEKSLVGYYIVSEGKFRVVNPAVISYTGYAHYELIGKKADFMIHPEDREHVKKLARIRLTKNPAESYEFRILTKQGEIRWMMEVISPILFEGRPAILGNSVDITNRKTTEDKLKESEILYRAIFETTGASTVIIEEDNTLSLVNSEFEKLTGYSKEEAEEKMQWTKLVDARDQDWMVEMHISRHKNPQSAPRSYEYRLVDRQGRIKNMLSTVSLIPGLNKLVSSSLDITELKEKQNELLVKSSSLEDLNAALRVMLKQREEDRDELEKTLVSNVSELISPYLQKLKSSRLEKSQAVYLDLIASNLESIVSPFSRKLSAQFMRLTPVEIQVANLIKDGKSSKEIGNLLNISSAAVDVYRYHIRTKLGLNKKKTNLRSYLTSLM